MSSTSIYYDQQNVTPGKEDDAWDKIIELIGEIIGSLIPPPMSSLLMTYVAEGDQFSVWFNGQPQPLGTEHKTYIMDRYKGIFEECGCDIDPLLDSEINHTA